MRPCAVYSFFFLNDTATTEFYPLPLHDALPISRMAAAGIPDAGPIPRHGHRRLDHAVSDLDHVRGVDRRGLGADRPAARQGHTPPQAVAALYRDRKSTRLNSSHQIISYAVFCLK